jgi:hypothetical protein
VFEDYALRDVFECLSALSSTVRADSTPTPFGAVVGVVGGEYLLIGEKLFVFEEVGLLEEVFAQENCLRVVCCVCPVKLFLVQLLVIRPCVVFGGVALVGGVGVSACAVAGEGYVSGHI